MAIYHLSIKIISRGKGKSAVAAAALALGAWLLLRVSRASSSAATRQLSPEHSGRLPGRYWIFWLALMLGIAVEYCIIYWGADFVEKVLGFSKNTATQSVSLFMVGMIVGRFFGSRLLERVSAMKLLWASIALSVFGFILFWSGVTPLLGIIGLVLLGYRPGGPIDILVGIAAAAVMLVIPATRFGPRLVANGASYWTEVKAGLRFIRRHPVLWPLVIILAFVATMNAYQIPNKESAQGIPIPVLIWIAVALGVSFLVHRTRFGRYVFAMGGNPDAAALVAPGVAVQRRTTAGGAGPAAVAVQLERFRSRLAELRAAVTAGVR